jgi:dihydroflavonol-4-reductase
MSSLLEEASVERPLVAVTGAAGFTGGALVHRLLHDGFPVRALVRPGQRIAMDTEWKRQQPSVGRERLDIARGDLGDPAALARLVRGAEIVFHVAGMFRKEGPREQFFDINERGTENMLAAARAAGARRFVHCSTIGVYGHVPGGPADEQSPFCPRDAYQESKVKGEEVCRRAMASGEVEVTIIRPCSIYGPGDLRMLKLFRMLLRRRFLLIGSGDPNFHPVYIDDLVSAFIAAAQRPEAVGEDFIIGGPRYLPLATYIGLAAAAVGAPQPKLRVPYSVMEVAARVCERICTPLGIEPPLHRRRLSFFKHNRAFRIDKARRLLGYEPTVDIEQGFQNTVRWYRSERLL